MLKHHTGISMYHVGTDVLEATDAITVEWSLSPTHTHTSKSHYCSTILSIFVFYTSSKVYPFFFIGGPQTSENKPPFTVLYFLSKLGAKDGWGRGLHKTRDIFTEIWQTWWNEMKTQGSETTRGTIMRLSKWEKGKETGIQIQLVNVFSCCCFRTSLTLWSSVAPSFFTFSFSIFFFFTV